MPSLSGMTLAQLRAATVGQIQTAMKARIDTLSKRHLIRLDLYVRDWDSNQSISLPNAETATFTDEGQIASREEVGRDVLGGKTGTVRHEWTYYPLGGEVDTITRIELDASDVEIARRTIKHFTDGRQPRVI